MQKTSPPITGNPVHVLVQKKMDIFLKLVKNYTVPDKLFPELLHAFVEKIVSMPRTSPAATGGRKSRLFGTSSGELKHDEDKQTIERQRKSRTA